MSVNKYNEVEVLKEELNFLTDLLQEHKTREARYQKPQFCGMPYGHPSVYDRQKSVKNTNLNCLSTYKSKYHANRTGKVMSRSFVHKPASVSIFPKQNIGYSARHDTLWKYNQTPTSTQNLSSSSFKIVRTAASAKVTNTGSEIHHVANNAKAIAGCSISTLNNKIHSSEVGTKTTKDSQVSNFLKPTSEYASSKKDHLQPFEKNVASKHPKGAKVSYVTCSDCIIEISEYENGELHISQKKLDPSVQDNEESEFISSPSPIKVPKSPSPVKVPKSPSPVKVPKSPSPVKVPKSPSPVKVPKSPSPVKILKSSWSDTVCEKGLSKGLSDMVRTDDERTSGYNCVYQKPFTGSDSSTAKGTMISNAVGADIKLSNKSSPSPSKDVTSLCKFNKSQQPCARNAKYSKVNVSTSKSQNSVAKLILKNKYSVKKSNVVKYNSSLKCKANKELKGCTSHLLKYTRAPKSVSQKCLVNYSANRTAVLPVGNVNKRTAYTSYSSVNSLRPSHTRGKVTKSGFPLPSYPKISRKAKTLHAQSVYKVVNKLNLVTSKAPKSSHLCKTLSKSNPSSFVLRNGDHSSDKKWFKSNDGAISLAHCSSNAGAQQNQSNTVTKNEMKKVLPSSMPYKTSSCELANALNTSKVISRHSLQRFVQKKSSTKKPSLNSSLKSFSDSHSAIKKAKKVRLSKTTYKVVNRYANHVSQVVQMIKTKYRTVNKRSASNSHLKWLQDQKRAYLARKVKKSLHSHTKTGWAYHHSVQHRTRKHPVLHPKVSRKRSLGPNKVLKNIHGVPYKVSKTQIKKSFTPKRMKKSHFTLRNKKNSVIVNVRGTKFQMSPGGKSLKRLRINKEVSKTLLRKIKIGGLTYVQQKEGSSCLVKSSSTTQNVASRMLHRSINTVRAAEAKKTLRKNNMFCMFFNRFGRCNKEGNCPYIHDPSKIAVCTRFLRGTCKISGCPFSHEISPGKMAICSFFLQGNCTNSNCPYRHTSIKPGTKLCKAFVKGYCNKGSECQDAHIHACPQFICEGFCEKGLSCTWPHPPVKNNIKKRSDVPEVGKEVKEIKEKDATADDISDQRYFTYEPGLVSDKCIKFTESVGESIQTQTNERIAKARNKKIAFPKQPAFIPLFVSDEEL